MPELRCIQCQMSNQPICSGYAKPGLGRERLLGQPIFIGFYLFHSGLLSQQLRIISEKFTMSYSEQTRNDRQREADRNEKRSRRRRIHHHSNEAAAATTPRVSRESEQKRRAIIMYLLLPLPSITPKSPPGAAERARFPLAQI